MHHIAKRQSNKTLKYTVHMEQVSIDTKQILEDEGLATRSEEIIERVSQKCQKITQETFLQGEMALIFCCNI